MIDEAELQSILEITNKKNLSFPYWYYDKIEGSLDDMSDPETKAEFRLRRVKRCTSHEPNSIQLIYMD